MSDEYGSNYYSISDDEGNVYELEHLDTIEMDGTFYLAFLPTDVDVDSEQYGILILKQETDASGEQFLVVPEDDEEIDRVYDRFMQQLYEEDGEE